jgi:hypothetical protein
MCQSLELEHATDTAQSRDTQLFERVLFVYTIEHQDGNYWQGLNDLVIPFICTMVARVFGCTVSALNSLKSEAFAHILFKSEVEADIYWCLTHFVNAIQVVGSRERESVCVCVCVSVSVCVCVVACW